MYSYALKRLIRGKGVFLALFLSVTLAATLFSGILQGADAVSASMLDIVQGATDVDLVFSAEDRDLTRTSLSAVEDSIGNLEQVAWVEHLIRSVEQGIGEGIEVNVTGAESIMPFTVVALASDSPLVTGIEGIDALELGMIYVESGSMNASLFNEGDPITFRVPTYIPGGDLIDIQKRYAKFTIGSMVKIDDRLFSIAYGKYTDFLVSLLTGTTQTIQRPTHQLIIMSEETFLGWINRIYSEGRRHTRVLVAETIIGLDRDILLNPWNLAGSSRNVRLVAERVNSIGAQYGFSMVDYLGQLLESIEAISVNMKSNTLLVAAPIIFTAWYLGVTISEISLNQRRREIGLFFTRGFAQRQIIYFLLFEVFLVGILAGAMGLILGSIFFPLAISGMRLSQAFSAISPVTVGVSFIFSGVLALLVMYKPAKRAVSQEIIDALREYQSEEEDSTDAWHTPALAMVLGLYRVAMLVIGVTVEQFRPTTGNFFIFLAYSTWWGVDFILTYIAPILLFWGFTKLVIQNFSWFPGILERINRVMVGDIAKFSALSARRNVRRTTASTFMAALILAYGVSVIGGIASTDDFTQRFVMQTIGADASVWLFDGGSAEEIMGMVEDIEGVEAATVEKWFQAQSAAGLVSVRIIDPSSWRNIAYMEEGWIQDVDSFSLMDKTSTHALLEKGVAQYTGAEKDFPWLIQLGNNVHTFVVVGLYGRDPGANIRIPNPALYIPDTYVIKEKYIDSSRLLVKLEGGADPARIKAEIEALDHDVEGVDIADEIISVAASNPFLASARQVEELGVSFAALISSLGIMLIVSTALASRRKELTVMAIRGFSSRQLTVILLVENLGMTLFSVVIGLTVSLVMLSGQTELVNATLPFFIQRRVVFPISAQVKLASVIGILLVSTILPIVLSVGRISNNPLWKTNE
jgi:ABC-type antimicrobial peptide transport system permease subunit